VDIGNSVDIITLECLKKLQYTQKDLEAVEVPIVRFRGQTTYPLRTKELLVRVRDKDNSRTIDINFLFVDILRAYNAILRRPTVNAIKAVYLLLI